MKKYEEHKGYYYKIIQDNFSESPGEWGNDFAFLIYQHRLIERVHKKSRPTGLPS